MRPGAEHVARIKAMFAHRVVRNALLMYVVQFSGYIFPLISLPYLAGVLSTEKFGQVAYAQFFTWYFVVLTEYGFNLTATRAVAVERGNPAAVARIFSAVMAAKTLLTALGFAILCVVVFSVPSLRPNFALFAVSFTAVIGNLLFPLWLYQGLEELKRVAVRDFLAKLLSLLLLFVLVHGDGDYLWAAAAQSGGFLLSGIAGLLPVRRYIAARLPWPSWREVAMQFRTGFPGFLSLALSAFGAVTNVFVLGLCAPASEVAFFTGAQRMIAALRQLVNPISTAIYPFASGKAARSEGEVLAFVGRYALLLSAPFILVGAVIFAAAGPIVDVMLGAGYEPSIAVMRWMAFVPLLFSLTQVYSTYYMLACGYDREWMRIVIATVVVNFLSLAATLAFLRGSTALAVTALLSEGAGTWLYWRFYARKRQQRSAAAVPHP